MNIEEKFFCNKKCENFPCHETQGEINCLFCFCPMYFLDKCLGNPEYKTVHGKSIKICDNCTFPHRLENYDIMMDYLEKEIVKGRKSPE